MSFKELIDELKEIKKVDKLNKKKWKKWNSKIGLAVIKELKGKWEVFRSDLTYFALKYVDKDKIPKVIWRIFAEGGQYFIEGLDASISSGFTLFITYRGGNNVESFSTFVLELRKLGVKMSMKTVKEMYELASREFKTFGDEIAKWEEAFDVF